MQILINAYWHAIAIVADWGLWLCDLIGVPSDETEDDRRRERATQSGHRRP